MSQTNKTEQSFEEAFDKIAIASWNRIRTNSELRSFINSHHDAVIDVEL
jgi:hypothetical protein